MTTLSRKFLRLLTAPVFDDEERIRIAGILNIILLSGLGMVVVAGLVNVSISPRPFPQLVTACGLFFWLLVHLALFRAGFIQLVSLLLPSTAWVMITLLVTLSGGITSPNAAGYLTLIIGIGLVFGVRYGIYVTIISLLAGLVMLAAQARDLLPTQILVYHNFNVWAVYLIWFTLSAILLHLGTKEIAAALRQARHFASHQSSVAKQQAAIARLGQTALETDDLTVLFDKAAELTAHTLQVKYSQILELLPTGDRLLMRAGIGWKDGLVGLVTVMVDESSMAGFVLRQDKPIIMEYLQAETRFPAPPLLVEHHAVSGISTIIHSQENPFGILSVYTQKHRRFMEDEIYFLSTIANILATAIKNHRAEAALRVSERKYRNILESIQEGYFEVDLAGNLTFFNDSLCRIAGLPQDELMGMNNREYTSPETAKRIYQAFNEVYRTGKPASVMNYEIIRKDGSKIIAEMSISLRRDTAGEPIGFRGIVRDMTENKRAEEALWVSEERYRRLFEEARDGIFLADAETGIIVGCNQAAAELVDREISELVGQHQRILHPPIDNSQKFTESFQKHLNESEGQVLEQQVITSSGEIREVAIKANLMHVGDKKVLQGMFRDITDYKRAEKALRESEQMLREIHENAIEGIFRTTPEGQVLYANEAIANMFGYDSAEEFLNVDVRDLYFMPDERERVLKPFKDRIHNLELQMRRKDGRKIWVQENSVLIRGDDGKIKWYEGFLSDITDRKEAEEALHQSEEQLRHAQKMEAVGHLAGGVAHDFNNVLAQILTATELLEERIDEKSLNQYLDILKGSVERGRSVTERILRFSRKEESHYESLSIRAILKDVIHVAVHTFPRNIAVKLNRYRGKDLVWGDPAQLHLVFMNLCLNAADAMPDGGKLTMSMRKPKASEERRYIPQAEGDYVCIVVTDTGVGMELGMAELVFDPFFSTKKPGKSTGLGLSIAYKIVTDHNGWIDLESTPSEGTTFTIGLPLSTKEPAVQDIEIQEEKSRGRKEHILVVEDEPTLRTLLEEVLRSQNYTVSIADNGNEAWEFIQKHRGEIDLVISDLGMPGMDGKELAQRIHTYIPGMKIIISSGNLEPDELAELKRYGMHAALSKPYRVNDLIHTIVTALNC
ncbi:MAG: PAS domain S-box protein [Fidelibacterota bacterium]|nr:MAG: PAS domain S-box protein [Candidatus Neomarinimicrobiota bacterium]